MKFVIRNYPSIMIPEKLLIPMDKPFKADTPYVSKIAARWKSKSYLNKKLPLKILCLESIRDRALALGGYETYSDPMAGIGISARIFGAQRKVFLNDLDEGCRQVLEVNYTGKITANDILTQSLQSADMIFLDFNDYTMKRGLTKYAAVVARAAVAAQKFLIINDCSLFYFRYGKTSFGVYSKLLKYEIESVDDYFAAITPFYKKLGLQLVQANYFRDTSFLLLSKGKGKFMSYGHEAGYIPSGLVQVLS